MRERLLKLNTLTSLILQVVSVICGFVLPRMILVTYGSEVNGLVNSILQFLQVITFLELGVGAVVQSSLYRPLAEGNHGEVSKIAVSAGRFFRRIALILLFYVILLTLVYAFTAGRSFGVLSSALLILSISISSFAQYYFGVVDSLLLTADQRGYIQYTAQIITVILNTVLCVLFMRLGASIHIVKLTTSIVYLARPLFLRLYVDRHYRLDRRIKYEGEPIRQKWNGVAQHVAAVVLDGTDNIVLTLFSTLSNVSIYSVYHLVVYGVKNLFLSLTNGVHALIGELWARRELDTLRKTFGFFEWILHSGTVFVFGCMGVLLVPFVSVYTAGVTDVSYLQPTFAVLITLAHAGHCLRLPYSVMILAGGHYRETQRSYLIAAGINIVLSVVLVIFFGLVGVAIGTLVAMVYQTVYMAHYISVHLIRRPFLYFLRQLGLDALALGLGILGTCRIRLGEISYSSFALMAVKVAGVFLFALLLVNLVFRRAYLRVLFEKLKRGRN